MFTFTVIAKVTHEVRQALPTLILKLNDRRKKKGKPEDPAQCFAQACDDFEHTIVSHVDDFLDLVMEARPNTNDPEYEAKRRLYIEMVKGATLMMEHMKRTTTDLLTSFRLFIENLWEGICDGKDPQKISDAFAKYVDDYIKAAWAPMLEKLDRMIEEIDGRAKDKESK
ncbi:unnamed protein product [Rotaria socialis]|uniref:Uncharacterized protein n=1 Tax=Rotaria socialis TaxID=392032 RepID=A0A821V1R6_9BILA|nr:unnamed protein product [Rotaria socialis]